MDAFNLVSCAPNLKTDDVNSTVEFYQKFGFKYLVGLEKGTKKFVPKYDPKIALMFAKLQNGNVTLLFDDHGNEFDKNQKVGGSFSLFCGLGENVDIKKTYEVIVKKKLAKIKKELQVTFYGKEEFWIEDNNGYILGFFKDSKKKK